MAKQIGEVVDAYTDLGPTLRSPWSEPPPKPSARTVEIAGKLGLRYPPASSVDRDSHAARVALLAEDCADLPPEWLDAAAREWAKTEPFMPRACELRDKAILFGRVLSPPSLPAPIAEPTPPPPLKPVMDRRGEAMSDDDTAELNTILASLGATARYRADGSRYSVAA